MCVLLLEVVSHQPLLRRREYVGCLLGFRKQPPTFFGSRGGVETDFPLVILAGLELAMLD